MTRAIALLLAAALAACALPRADGPMTAEALERRRNQARDRRTLGIIGVVAGAGLAALAIAVAAREPRRSPCDSIGDCVGKGIVDGIGHIALVTLVGGGAAACVGGGTVAWIVGQRELDRLDEALRR